MTDAMNWGDTKGEAQSNKVTFMKQEDGTNHIRIVGGIVRKYDYWVTKTNEDGSQLSVPFENLRFNRDTESFVQGAEDPISELGLQNYTGFGNSRKPEFDKEGEPVPLKSKKAYVCPVINRKTNQIEYMELKKGIFDGVKDVMAQVNSPKIQRRMCDPEYSVPNPMFIDIIYTKSGKGLDTTYKVELMDVVEQLQDEDEFAAMMKRHKEDEALIADMKPNDEVLPRKTPAEQREAVNKFLYGDDEDKPAEEQSDAEQEAMNELDD